MISYLIKSRQGQFLAIGILFAAAGFIFGTMNSEYSRWLFGSVAKFENQTRPL
ncbi:hypothetical protein [Enterococcus faecium]|uniref:hypothetical protein n=1 Tax=Enterococcus faecium TaxID=1352 RepID=UPI001CCBDFB0|nr:hypothetical protein [Enterococcus faecium]